MTEFVVNPECPFSLKSFNLLEELKNNSSKEDFYLKHQEDFKRYIEQPFKYLYQFIIAQLSGEIIKFINTNVDLQLDWHSPFLEYELYLKQINKFS